MKTISKLLLISMTIFTAIQVTYGQISFSHSGGASFYGSSLASAPGLMYSPRINFLELRDELTISAGTHLGLGVVYSRDEGASSFAFDLPLVAEINFGHGANPDTRSSFGGFGGFGFGISKIGSAGAFGADYNDAAGIVLNGGIRAIINKNPLGLRLSYLINTKEGFENVISLGIFFTFGDF